MRVRDTLEDLRTRWRYHPTFDRRVTLVAVVLCSIIGIAFFAYAATTDPACTHAVLADDGVSESAAATARAACR